MEYNQNRQASGDPSKHRFGTSSTDYGDLKATSRMTNALFASMPTCQPIADPFSTYFPRAGAANVVERGNRSLQGSGMVDDSGATMLRGSESTVMINDQISSSRFRFVPPSQGFGPYRPEFSEVLLNAANILESRGGSAIISTANSEGFRSQMSEQGLPGISDSMPVLQSHAVADQGPASEYGLIIKQEVSGLTPSSSMPCLLPENDSETIEQSSFITHGCKETTGPNRSQPFSRIKEEAIDVNISSVKEDLDFSDWVTMSCKPFNMRLVNLSNFPITQTLYRTNYRSHSTACVRARMGSIQNTAKSLDLMRSLLQKSINKEIDIIIQKYIEEYFHPAIDNIRLNNGENAVSEEHMQTVCRQILEEAKKMYSSDTRSVTPVDLADMSDVGSQADSKVGRNSQLLLPGLRKRERRLSSGSESSSHTVRTKKKARPLLQVHGGSGRSTPSRSTKSDAVRREGPLWDPERLKHDVQFVMGSKANKALGLGATRGRLYIKHPDIFKYSGDQDDKQWLHEHHHMPATGGRTYLLLVDDIRELAQTDEYRNSGALQLEELVGFTVPDWMLEKMKFQMQSMRTDFSRPSKLIYDAAAFIGSQDASPANTNTMSPERDDVDADADVDADDDKPSTLNMTGRFTQVASPSTCGMTHIEAADDNTALTGSFYSDSM